MKKQLAAAALGMTIMITGCASKSEVPQSTATTAVSETEAQTETERETEVSTEAEETTKASEGQQKSYFGSWVLTSCKGTSAVYAMSQEEIDSHIGTTITYTADSYTMNGNSMAVQGYEEEAMNEDIFQLNFGITFSDFGITEPEVSLVSVLAEGNLFGGYFYVQDENTLIIYTDGVFFEAARE